MQTVDAVVRLKTLDGVWETCGVDRRRGIVPEGIQLQANDWGPDTASFTLKRKTDAIWPDLTAFTPVEIEIGGVLVWGGFISQTPTTDADGGSVSVECKGWQYHLDDDSFEYVWVHSKLSDWKDTRTMAAIEAGALGQFRVSGSVNVNNGRVLLGWSRGAYMTTGTSVGVTLDLGPDNTAYGARVKWKAPSGFNNTNASMQFAVTCSNDLSTGASINGTSATPSNGAYSNNAWTQSNTNIRGTDATFARPGRYVHVLLSWIGTGGQNNAVLESLVQVLSVDVYSTSALYTAQKVTAKQVVTDSLKYAPLLSSDTSKVQDPGFAIPHFAAIDGGRTPREHITAANAYHDYQAEVGPDAVFTYRSRSTSPTVSVGNWGGSEFTDASANSADEIYNKVIVEGEGANGAQLRIPVLAAQLSTATGAQAAIQGAVTSGNPLASGGLTAAGTESAITFASGVGTWNGGTGKILNESLDATLTGSLANGITTYYAGITYTLTFNIQASGFLYGLSGWYVPYVRFGIPDGTSGYTTDYAVRGTEFVYPESGAAPPVKQVSVSWTPKVTVATADANKIKVFLSLEQTDLGDITTSYNYKLDTFAVSYATTATSLPDRRKFTRTKRLQANSPITTESATFIGKAFLSGHRQTPLKGSVRIQPGGVRDYNSGASVHPSQLLLKTGELMHLSQRIDPNTGAQGRDGQIASVTYDHSSQSADISIDNQRNRFEALLERLSVVTGNRLGR